MRERYISEGYYEAWSGCLVRVPGFPQTLFSWSHYATEQECRRAAIVCRDDYVKQAGGWDKFPPPGGGHTGHHHRYTAPLKRNRLGILGVHIDERVRIQKRKNGSLYKRWVRRAVAQLRIKGVADMRADFTYKRGDKQRAIAQAIQARNRFERKRDAILARR